MTGPPLIRMSERKDFKRCPQRWYWAWRMGLNTKGRAADALWFGTGVHIALAEWYCGPGLKRGPHPAETWLSWSKEEMTKIRTAISDNWEEDVWVEARELGEFMLDGYVEEYGRDDSWHVIAPEQTFQIDIPFRNKDGIMATHAGTFDLVYRDLIDDSIWLGEHKTAKQVTLGHLPLDDQAGTYWAVAGKTLGHQGVLRKGDTIEGIMYNFLRKGMPDERPVNEKGQSLNKDGSVSKIQPKPLFHREPVYRTRSERAAQLRRIQDEATWMAAARKAPDRIYKTPTRDCEWDCKFFEMCQLHEKGGTDWIEFQEAVFTQRDPYADHRKSASE